ncbi:MAG: putative transrane protein [Ramlibacter sp.]|nr:putative transrane protein [Ramlibacter sp.]
MSQTASIWIVILAALAAANLPFINERLLAVMPLAREKNLAIRVAELVLMYFLVGGLGLLLEQHAGQIAPQTWEFYAVTGPLFIILAFPGFIWRYLRRHHPRPRTET